MFAENLQKGDFILVSYGNRLSPAIFVKYGQGGSIQFYNIWDDSSPNWRKETCCDYYFNIIHADKRRPYKAYVNAGHSKRFAKASLEHTRPDLVHIYTNVKKLLIDNKYL